MLEQLSPEKLLTGLKPHEHRTLKPNSKAKQMLQEKAAAASGSGMLSVVSYAANGM